MATELVVVGIGLGLFLVYVIFATYLVGIGGRPYVLGVTSFGAILAISATAAWLASDPYFLVFGVPMAAFFGVYGYLYLTWLNRRRSRDR